jgi:hypothetical protein
VPASGATPVRTGSSPCLTANRLLSDVVHIDELHATSPTNYDKDQRTAASIDT